jgi:hypothetical protein
MDVQEITAKVTALVKKHPYLAGAAILLVVVLGYLGYKKAGAGGSADSAPVDTSVSQDFGSGGSGGSGETGTSTLPSDLFSQLYPTQQAEPAQVDTSGGGNFGGGGNVNPADFGGSYVPPADSGYVPPVSSSPTPAQASETLAGGWSAGGLASAASLVSGWSAGGLAKNPNPVVSAPVVISGNSSGSIDKSGWSPARLLGKGQNYTGWIGSQYYEKGYPNSSSVSAKGASAPVIKVTTSGVSVSGHSTGGIAVKPAQQPQTSKATR